MLIYTAKRIGLALLIVLVAMTMLFSMIYLVPGDPASDRARAARHAGDEAPA